MRASAKPASPGQQSPLVAIAARRWFFPSLQNCFLNFQRDKKWRKKSFWLVVLYWPFSSIASRIFSPHHSAWYSYDYENLFYWIWSSVRNCTLHRKLRCLLLELLYLHLWITGMWLSWQLPDWDSPIHKGNENIPPSLPNDFFPGRPFTTLTLPMGGCPEEDPHLLCVTQTSPKPSKGMFSPEWEDHGYQCLDKLSK